MKADKNVFPQGLGDVGLTTRDYIAIQAMTGAIANPELNRSFNEIADMAYKQADAMIKQSEVSHE